MWCRDIASSGWLSWRRSAPCVCGVREGCGVPRAVLLVVGGGGEPGRLWPPPELQPLSFCFVGFICVTFWVRVCFEEMFEAQLCRR